MRKKVIVACAGAVATSTVAAKRVAELCKVHHIEAEICQVRIAEIESNLLNVHLLITTSRIKKDYGIPYVMGMPFITGINVEKTEQEILRILEG